MTRENPTPPASAQNQAGSKQHLAEWATLIADHVYTETSEGLPVYLDIDDDFFSQLKSATGLNFVPTEQHLVQSVTDGLKFRDPNIFSYFLEETKNWRNGNETITTTPSLPLLTVLVRAAEVMQQDEQFAANNYYNRLIQQLGLRIEDKETLEKSYRKNRTDLF